MKTALITLDHKQQIILQPENLREHHVLQMLLLKHADIQVQESELEITEHGALRKWQQTSYGQKQTPLLVQVQGPAPVMANPEAVVLAKSEVRNILFSLLSMSPDWPGGKSNESDKARAETMLDSAVAFFLDRLKDIRETQGIPAPKPFL